MRECDESEVCRERALRKFDLSADDLREEKWKTGNLTSEVAELSQNLVDMTKEFETAKTEMQRKLNDQEAKLLKETNERQAREKQDLEGQFERKTALMVQRHANATKELVLKQELKTDKLLEEHIDTTITLKQTISNVTSRLEE